jgi:hypothetical protein
VKQNANSKEAISMTQENNQPEAKFSTGAIQATVWKNTSDKDEQEYRTVSLSRRYKDKDDTWKSTNSLRINDLPKAELVLRKAYEFIVLKDTTPMVTIPESMSSRFAEQAA